ncbi:MAG: hypothetical protein II937_13780 [Bacteroidales bacterium]|nr:hypothetical protein [Bacteroidales bacterium]
MKDKILEALKTKYSSLGLSKEVLDGYADYLSSSITEEAGIEDGIAQIENLLKIQQKEFDKIRTTAKKKAEEEKTTTADESPKKNTANTDIEQKTEEKGKPVKTEKADTPEPKKEEEIPSWAKALLGKVEQLEKRNSENDKAQRIEKRRKAIEEIEKNLQPTDKTNFKYVQLDMPDEDFESFKAERSEIAKQKENELNQRAAVIKPPMVNNNDGSKPQISKERADEFAKRLLNR